MHPYVPYAALPIAAIAAWYGASHWSASDPGRYSVSRAQQIEDPSALMVSRAVPAEKPDIRIKAFLPHIRPKPPEPEPTFVLHSVMTGTNVRLATINGKIVRQGDEIEGYKVRKISHTGVQLVKGKKVRRLSMRPLHELPPPALPGNNPVKKKDPIQRETDLNQDFWKIFDSLKP